MGYFPNGSAGDAYEAQYCARCVHRDTDPACPVMPLRLKSAESELSELRARDPDMLGSAGRYQPSPRPAGDLDRSSGATDDASPSHGEAPAAPEVKVTEDSDEGPVRISWNGKEWAQASALTEAESELNRAYDCLNHWKGEADKLRAELELVRGELSEARELAARLRQSAIDLAAERDAAREGERRVRAALERIKRRATESYDQRIRIIMNGPAALNTEQAEATLHGCFEEEVRDIAQFALTPPTGGES